MKRFESALARETAGPNPSLLGAVGLVVNRNGAPLSTSRTPLTPF